MANAGGKLLGKLFSHRHEAHFLFPPAQLGRASAWTSAYTAGKDALWGWQFFMPLSAYTAAKEPPGERLASFVPEAAGLLTNIPLSAGTAIAMATFIPGFNALNPAARSAIAMLTSDFLINQPMVRKVASGMRQLSSLHQRKRNLETGTGYQDSQAAYNMRVAAIQEMSFVHGAQRRLFGQEARLLHR